MPDSLAPALVLATEVPEGIQLAKLLRARAEKGDKAGSWPALRPTQATWRDRVTVYDARAPPSITLTDYLSRWVTYAQVQQSVIIIAAIYVDRMLERTAKPLTLYNVHRILFGALICATKLREDAPFSNQHYADIGGVCLQEANRLECSFLNHVGWDLHVEVQEYDAMAALLAERAYGRRGRRFGVGVHTTPPDAARARVCVQPPLSDEQPQPAAHIGRTMPPARRPGSSPAGSSSADSTVGPPGTSSPPTPLSAADAEAPRQPRPPAGPPARRQLFSCLRDAWSGAGVLKAVSGSSPIPPCFPCVGGGEVTEPDLREEEGECAPLQPAALPQEQPAPAWDWAGASMNAWFGGHC